MSMTKRYLESLPEEEQNAILGGVDPDYEEYWDAVETEEPRCGHVDTGCGDVCNIRDGYGVGL